RLDNVRIVKQGAQCGSVTNALPGLCRVLRVRECRDRDPLSLHPERHIAARCYKGTEARREYVLTERDVLTGNVRLVLATIIVEADVPAIGGRALRPIDPAIFERELLGWMIAGRQTGDKRRNDPGIQVDGNDARAAVLAAAMGCLIGVGREQPATLEAALEADVDRWSGWLEPAAATCRLSNRSGDFFTALVEDQDVGRERVRLIENPAGPRALFVADAGQAMPRFEHKDLKLVLVAKEGDPGRHVQTLGEDRDRETR